MGKYYQILPAATDTGFLTQLKMYQELEFFFFFKYKFHLNDKAIIGLLVRELRNT